MGESQTLARLENIHAGRGARPFSIAQRRALIVSALLVSDGVMLTLAFWLAYLLRFRALPYYGMYDMAGYMRLFALSLPAWLTIFAIFQTYSRDYLFGGLGEYAQVFHAVSVGMLALIVFGFMERGELAISRGWLLLAWALAFLLTAVGRFGVRRAVYALRRHGHLLSPALLVGANQEGLALAQQLSSWATSGLFLSGFVDDEVPLGEEVFNGQRVLGRIEDLERLVAEYHIQEVIIAPTALKREQLLDLFRVFSTKSQVHLRLSSGLFEVVSSGLKVKELAYVPLVEFNTMRISGLDMLMKQTLDYLVVLLALPFLLPVLGILALLIRLDSPGPAIHRRRVMGVNGKQFDAFKFRTMYVNGDEILAQHPHLKDELARQFKLKDDPRVTRLGRWLRRFSLDELPQVFNVLMNQMSLVGPRMISPPEMKKYGKWGINLLTVKPGITGLWQVSGRSDLDYEERVRMDMEYIRNWTIWLDLYLLLRTPLAVLSKRGAY